MTKAEPRPNIIHLFADDLGYGDVGFNGQTKILTPNLDRLAAQSLKFSRAYAAPVCGPSRGMLLTGLHNGHASFDRNSQNDRGLLASDVTVADVLQDAGYHTAIFGKWGSGEDRNNPGTLLYPDALPTQQGFDSFYGYLNHNEAKEYFAPYLWRTQAGQPHNLRRVATGANANAGTGYSHDLIAAATESWLMQAAMASEAGTPFYLQMSYTIPHFDLDAIADVPGGLDPYVSEPWTDKQKKRAAMITRMDAAIGRILDLVRDPNQDGDTSDSIAADTLIIFTSDNGPTDVDGSDWVFFNSSGPYRGGKRDLFEGGIRVSALFSMPGTIQPGTDTTTLTDLADFMPTALDLAGQSIPNGLDGVSLWPRLRGDDLPSPTRPHLVFENHEWDGPDPDTREAVWTVIQSRYKLIHFADESFDLYDVPADPDESDNLADSHPDVVAALTAIAIDEGLEQPEGYALRRTAWDLSTADLRTVQTLEHAGGTPALTALESNVDLLGLSVAGTQTLHLRPGVRLRALNELRLEGGARLAVELAEVQSKRIQVGTGAVLEGVGTLTGTVLLRGTLSPGWPEDLAATEDPPPYDSGVVPLLTFDFTGVQDDAPLNATSTLHPQLTLTRGLDFGPGIQSRGSLTPTDSNVGNEFNTSLFNAESLAAAITEGDYWGFAVRPNAGYTLTLDRVSVDLWRNGENAASDYALLAGLPGFQAEKVLDQVEVVIFGQDARQVYTLDADPSEETTEALDVRVYGWNALFKGNTHLQGMGMRGRIQSIDRPDRDPFERLDIHGDLIQHPGSDIRMQITANGEQDQLHITGRFHAGGRLEVACVGPPPQPGDRFDLFDAGTFTGEFERMTLPRLEDGHGWDTQRLYSEGVLEVVAASTFSEWITGAGLPTDRQAPEMDDEPDGFPHIAEYVFGTRPGEVDRPGYTLEASASAFGFVWWRPQGREDVGISGQVASRLQPSDWRDLPAGALEFLNLPDGTQRVSLLGQEPGSPAFLRMQIMEP